MFRALLSTALPLLLIVLPARATPTGDQPAGEVKARIPNATRNAHPLAVKDTLQWNDLLKTEARGRLRASLTNGSILSVGSNSELKVVQHDASAQQTVIEMNYGKLRNEVVKITNPGGKYEVKTPNAVVGVIGTDFYVAYENNRTTVICYAGKVTVAARANPATVDNTKKNTSTGIGIVLTVAAGQMLVIDANKGSEAWQTLTASPAVVQASLSETEVTEELVAAQPASPSSQESAQTCCTAPIDEVFGGYSWSHPNGYGDLGYKVLNLSEGFDFSNTYYIPSVLGLGVLIDGSGHLNGQTQPTNPYTPGNTGSDVGYILTGLQYKYHTTRFSPFARVFVGTANSSPDCCGGTKWNVAGGGGGGVDLCVTRTLSIRLAQVDYIYSKYDQRFQSGYHNGWNSIRLASGIVLCLGCFSHPPPPSCSASATPAGVWAGEPVTVTTTGAKFNPKHTVNYDWTANGGQLSETNGQSATINTTGMAPGSYAASSTITDPKMKKMNSASCAVPFTIKQPQPPTVSCSANPATIAIGERSTIALAASDPQGWPLTYSWSSTGGQFSGTGASATLTATNADLGKTITVTGTASDGRTPPVSSSCTIMTKLPGAEAEKCITIADWGECTFEKNPKKPWRVDNDCKDTLDKLSLRLQQMPNGKPDIVGYTNKKEAVEEPTLGAQRAVNVKYYPTTDGPNKADGARIQPRQGGTEEGAGGPLLLCSRGQPVQRTTRRGHRD